MFNWSKSAEEPISELQKEKDEIHAENRKEKQHKNQKLTAWERIQYLIDEGTFVELNTFVEHRCNYFGMDKKRAEGDGVITGYGKVNGRTICVYAQDFTLMGGSIGEMNAKKISDCQKKAMEMDVPIVGLFDSGGARVQEGIQGLSGHGHIFYNNVQSSGKIPQISAIMGNCAGGASYSPALTDFIIMVEKTSNMFITGPKVVKTAIGQDVTISELGGPEVHSKISGIVDHVAKNDEDCLNYVKDLLAFLPSNSHTKPNLAEKINFNIKEHDVNKILPESNRKSYDVRRLIKCLVDDYSMMEIKPEFATSMVTTFARIGGYPVGIVANQPAQKAGCIDIDAADKASRFIRTCDNYNIPIVTLVDVSGFYPGKEQEQKGIIRHGAKMLYAYGESSVPKITVILRKAYGGAYLAMCSKELGADVVFAWPNSEMAVMSAEGAAAVIFRKDSPEEQAIKKAEYEKQFLSPKEAAHMGYVDDIIEPQDTRDSIIRVLDNCWDIWKSKKENFHRNIPV